MGKVIRLTESELKDVINRVIKEQSTLKPGMSRHGGEKWSTIFSALVKINPKPKLITFRDSGTKSLNWGSHSGPGFDWGLSIDGIGASGNGVFTYQGKNAEKAQKVIELAKKYNFPIRVENYNNGLYSDNIYSIPENNFVSFVKEVLNSCFSKIIQEETNMDTSCLKGFKYTEFRGETPYGTKIPSNWIGKYQGKEIILYSEDIFINASGRYNAVLYPDKRTRQRCRWKCENGKLVIYGMGELELDTIDEESINESKLNDVIRRVLEEETKSVNIDCDNLTINTVRMTKEQSNIFCQNLSYGRGQGRHVSTSNVDIDCKGYTINKKSMSDEQKAGFCGVEFRIAGRSGGYTLKYPLNVGLPKQQQQTASRMAGPSTSDFNRGTEKLASAVTTTGKKVADVLKAAGTGTIGQLATAAKNRF